MTERLEVVDHHVNLISRIIGDAVDMKKITTKIRINYARECHQDLYPFTNEHSLENLVIATAEIATAMIDNNFKPIPNYTDASKTQRNFDKICCNCPNHDAERKLCRLDQEGIWPSGLKGIHLDTPRNDK